MGVCGVVYMVSGVWGTLDRDLIIADKELVASTVGLFVLGEAIQFQYVWEYTDNTVALSAIRSLTPSNLVSCAGSAAPVIRVDRVPPEAYASTPLFRRSSGAPFTTDYVREVVRFLMSSVGLPPSLNGGAQPSHWGGVRRTSGGERLGGSHPSHGSMGLGRL